MDPTCPSSYTQDEWIWHKSPHIAVAADFGDYVGKWMVFQDRSRIGNLHKLTQLERSWGKVVEAMEAGSDVLPSVFEAKVSTALQAASAGTANDGVIIAYTPDYRNHQEVLAAAVSLHWLLNLQEERAISYKSDESTYAGIYSGGRQRPSMYKYKQGQLLDSCTKEVLATWQGQ
eukprot:jgi/Chrzof1/9791/Cz04g15260.t1